MVAYNRYPGVVFALYLPQIVIGFFWHDYNIVAPCSEQTMRKLQANSMLQRILKKQYASPLMMMFPVKILAKI
jgi:hypothetical protein